MPKIKLDPGPFVLPMPVALVGANADGKPNFLTAGFVSVMNYKPAVVACGLSPSHRTSEAIVATKAFSLNVPSQDLVEATDWCGLVSGAKTDKSKAFRVFAGEKTGAPLIEECRLSVECQLLSTVPLAMDTIYLGEVVAVYADAEVLTDGAVDWMKIAPLLLTVPEKKYWQLGAEVASAWSVGKKFRPSAQ